MKRPHLRLILLCLLLLPARLPHAQTQNNNLAPGAPGKDAQWPSAGKSAVGTSNTLESKVWFTLREGVLTEVYYPTVDVGNTQVLQFIVVSADGKRVETEMEDATHRIEVLNPTDLTFRQTNTAKSGAYTITKTYVTDPERSTVLIDVEFKERRAGAHRLYVYYDPSLNNSGMHDSAWRADRALLASDADKASALLCEFSIGAGVNISAFEETSNGFFQTSDGLTELRKGGAFNLYQRAADGNVVQVARIGQSSATTDVAPSKFTLALGFGREADEALKNARASLDKGFARARAEYDESWRSYISSLRRVDPKYRAQFDMAAMVLKAHEDKTFRGAMIASLSIPWGGGASANEPNVGGYHLVWSRDLYQVATAFYALGDKASADRALDYLFRVQQKQDGSFPQNSWLDGRPFWGSLQLDEVAYPLVLAYQLGRTDNETYVKHVRPAADFIVRHGPWTPQERWEEESGFSPSTIAAEIAGLVSAAEIARRNNDEASATIYTAAADEWARQIESWTATTTGKYGDGNYYLRLTNDGNPNDGSPLELNNGAGSFDEREIVDAGFLELVRLGIKPATDPLVAKSLKVIDDLIKVETPNGTSFYRYNHDGYGEMDDGRPWNWDGKYTGRGRLWALLAGERGEYELARGETEQARRRLDAMQGFANEGRMIPEQVWDKPTSPIPDLKFGEGTGSATPLAWSMAQFIRLAASIQEGRNIFQPDVVAARYAKAQTLPPRAQTSFDAPDETEVQRMEAGKSFKVRGRVQKGTRAFALIDGERRELSLDADGRYEFSVNVQWGETHVVVGTTSPTGATSFERVRARGLTEEERRREVGAGETPQFLERVKNATASPLIDGNRATFIYRGTAKHVEIAGDFTNWSPRGLVLRELAGTGVKYYTREFPKNARAEYKFIADGEWILDPLNRNRNDNGVGGENSFFTMPDYRATTIADLPPAGPQMSMSAFEVESRLLGGKRKIQVYLPAGYMDSQERYPVLYLQDGSEYYRRARATNVAGNLIAQKRVAPFIIVFVDPTNRMREYWANDQFADFMAKELVPHIDARFRTRPERNSRALLGASLGGVISVWTALRHPDVFARVGGQSSAFQIDDEKVVTALSKLEASAANTRPMKFYFDVGRMEPILDVNRRIQVMLRAKGFPVAYQEMEAGHNYTAWRDHLGDAMVSLWAN